MEVRQRSDGEVLGDESLFSWLLVKPGFVLFAEGGIFALG
mgnify:CR=1 FL=1